MRQGARLTVAAALVCTGLVAAGCKEAGPPASGDLAPDFVLQSFDGPTRKLSNYRGKLVLVNLWATWCPPCVAELPVLAKVSEEYGDKGLVILAVAGDEDPQTVREFLAKAPANYEVLFDPDGVIGTRYGITGYPETFFVDRQGLLRDKIIGPLPHEGDSISKDLKARIDALLGGH